MTRIILAVALVCAGVALPLMSVMAQPAGLGTASPPCLRQRNIYDFQLVPGNRSLVVIDLARKRYRLNFMGKCYNLQYHLGLGFKTHGVGTLSCVDKGDSVIMRDAVGPNQCIIKDIQVQTPAMDQADAAAASKRR